MIRLFVKRLVTYFALAAMVVPTLVLTAPVTAQAANVLPDVTITQPASGNFISDSSTIQIEGTAEDDGSIAEVAVLIENVTAQKYWDGSVWAGSETWLVATYDAITKEWGGYSLPSVIDKNEYKITARATDNEGGFTTTYIKLTGDNLAPVTVIESPETGVAVNSITVSGTATDAGSGVSKVEVREVGSASWELVSGTASWSYDFVAPKADAEGTTYTLEFRATDKAIGANVEQTTKKISLVKDSVAPSVGMTHYPADNTVDYNSTVVFRGVSEPGALMTININSDPIEQKTISVADGEWRFEVPASDLGSGSHSVSISATDSAGNVSTEYFTFSVAEQVEVEEETSSTADQAAVTYSQATYETAEAVEQTSSTAATPKTTDENFEEDVEKTAEGIIKAAETEEGSETSPWQTVITVIAILIIAVGVGTVGYYGYEWWATREQVAMSAAIDEANISKDTKTKDSKAGVTKKQASKKKASKKTGRRSSSRW